MRATVKVAYFDSKGLHKIGDIVDVKSPSRFVEIIEEVVSTAEEEIIPEPVETIEQVEEVVEEPKPKSKPKRRTKKG